MIRARYFNPCHGRARFLRGARVGGYQGSQVGCRVPLGACRTPNNSLGWRARPPQTTNKVSKKKSAYTPRRNHSICGGIRRQKDRICLQ